MKKSRGCVTLSAEDILNLLVRGGVHVPSDARVVSYDDDVITENNPLRVVWDTPDQDVQDVPDERAT